MLNSHALLLHCCCKKLPVYIQLNMSTLLLHACNRSLHIVQHVTKWHAKCTAGFLLTTATQQQLGFVSSTASGNQQQEGVALKSALRQLYKRVHPDLFTDYPAEQAENERSFKLLQDYLHQARSPTQGPASRTAYHFRFFLMPQPTASTATSDDEQLDIPASPDAAATAAALDFQEVAVSLVPPAPSRRGEGLSSAAVKALSKLLQLCGLPAIRPTEGEEQQDGSKLLTTFLPEAAEVVRQHESGSTLDEVRVANIRAAMRIAHQVKAGFPPGAFPAHHQVQLLQQLAAALDMLAQESGSEDCLLDLAGLNILICNKTALDSMGTLCLDAQDTADDWANFLGGVDVDYARNKKASAAALRQLESHVAAAVGVRMLFTAAHYLMSHEYRSLLERMAAHAAEHGPLQPGSSGRPASSSSRSSGFSSSDSSSDSSSGSSRTEAQQGIGLPNKTLQDIPVYVAPPRQHQQYAAYGQQQQRQSPVHELMGYIMVHMDDSARQVYDTVQMYSTAAAAVLSKRQQQQHELAELTTRVRTRLGLRRFYKDELISDDDYKTACRRLLQNRDLLQRCNIEGLSIRVSDQNKVSADGSIVNIAWNFEL